MKQLDQQIARRLTRFYVLALTVIAVLSISGLLFMKRTINNNDADSRVVNVAGRQRMLSQRLTKLALLRITGLPAADSVSFDSLLSTWSKSHIQLRNGTLTMEKAYVVRKSPRLDSMFVRVEPYFQSIYRGFVQVNSVQTTAEQKRAALAIILRDERSFLQQMNDIVFQFDTESVRRVRQLEQVEWLLTAATLLCLLIEGLFIFRPVVNHTRLVVHRLARSEKALQLANQHMERTNYELAATNQNLLASHQALTETQRDLLRTTEEKYQLQLAEENVRSAALLEGQEEERRRFARELHDGIGQMLTGLKLHAEKLRSAPFPDEKNRLRFTELCELIADTIQTTRQVSYNLMPSTLSDFGLEATLQLLAEQTARSAGTSVLFEGDGEGGRLSPSAEIGLYRIAQEALHNAVKYADASTIRICLQQDRLGLVLTVEDDGKGFSVKTVTKAGNQQRPINGLENMRTRARLLNSELSITSRLRKGTKVSVRINLSDRLH